MKLLKVLSLILIVGFVSCEQTPPPITESSLVGECFPSSRVEGCRICLMSDKQYNGPKGNYYRAYFSLNNDPKDFYLNCGGEGEWRFENNTIILGSNSSNCDNIRSVAGKYPQG